MTQPLHIYEGKKVLITGHTGFKGSWLSLWLNQLGATVIGLSLPPPTVPSLFDTLRLHEKIIDIRCDVRDAQAVSDALSAYRPDFIFHLAAKTLLIEAYQNPIETLQTNLMGTVHLLEAIRKTPSVKGILCATTDKVYTNREWEYAYRENDRLGGEDIYSASKAMCEFAVHSWMHSYFQEGHCILTTARAGNVIGGGDFGTHRLIPDAIRSLMRNETIEVRHPQSVRPWTYVLDILYGYLLLGSRQIEGEMSVQGGWNFGPKDAKSIDVQTLLCRICKLWGSGDWQIKNEFAHIKEKSTLRLSSEKAASQLGWCPKYHWEEAVEETLSWYQQFAKWMHTPDLIPIREKTKSLIHSYSFNGSL